MGCNSFELELLAMQYKWEHRYKNIMGFNSFKLKLFVRQYKWEHRYKI